MNREEALSSLIRDALAGKRGWRENARDLLGLSGKKECARDGCNRTFKTGGKRRRFCSDDCRDAHYQAELASFTLKEQL